MTEVRALAEAFEAHRPRLLAIATRVVGSPTDAQDVVQEAWLRLSRQEPGSIESLGAWLTTVVGRLSIDMIRSRTTRVEEPYEDQFLEPAVAPDDTEAPPSPEELALQADALGLALMVVLGSLRPEERLAFVLHDMFAVPFSEIGPIIDKSADAAKMAASRARRKVQAAPRPADSPREQRRVVDAFLAATRDGDFEALLEILDPDVVWELHGSRGVTVTRGRKELLGALRLGAGSGVTARRVLVNGAPGILAWRPSGDPLALMVCTVEDGRMTKIASLTDRSRLGRLDLPPRTSAE